MKFKVGDKVKIIKLRGYHASDVEVGQIGKIVGTDSNNNPYKVQYTGNVEDTNWFTEEELELAVFTKPTKDDLLAMPSGSIITTDLNEKLNRFLKVGDEFYDEEGTYCFDDSDIADDLSITDDDYGTKIIRIEKPIGYETIYDFSAEMQEMTIADIEKALGHPIKIVKEAE